MYPVNGRVVLNFGTLAGTDRFQGGITKQLRLRSGLLIGAVHDPVCRLDDVAALAMV